MRLAIAAATLLAGCTNLPHTWEPVEQFPILEAKQMTDAPVPDELRVMTWNVKFGGARYDFFFDGWGDRVHLTDKEVQGTMDGIYALIEETDPDILLAQEVDRDSKRSAFVDMATEILNNTDYNYAAWVPNWKVDYIPQNGLGQVEAGQAVFSKWPITRNTRIDLPQSEDSSALVNYFWLHRCVQIVEIDLDSQVLSVVNNHPAAYALDGTKQKHLKTILEESEGLPAPMITGGDFNVIPPGSIRTEGFADDAGANTPGVQPVSYSDDEMAELQKFIDAFEVAVDLAPYAAATTEEEQEPYYTHSVSGDVFWTQALDYLFATEPWTDAWTLQKPGDGDVPITSDPMQLSDHAPILATMDLP